MKKSSNYSFTVNTSSREMKTCLVKNYCNILVETKGERLLPCILPANNGYPRAKCSDTGNISQRDEIKIKPIQPLNFNIQESPGQVKQLTFQSKVSCSGKESEIIKPSYFLLSLPRRNDRDSLGL